MRLALHREVIAPSRSLARPSLGAILGCVVLLAVSQRCAHDVRSRLDAVVQFGASMGPAPARTAAERDERELRELREVRALVWLRTHGASRCC